MRKFRFKMLTALLVAVSFAGCSAERGDYHGALYYGQGPYLMQYSLGDGSVTVVDNLGDKSIRDVAGLGPDQLLIAETAWIQGKAVPRISWFDLRTGQSTVLYSGVHALYLAGAGVIVYDDGSKLYAVPQFGTGSDEVVLSHGLNELSALTAVSDSVLLFETADERPPVIQSWQAGTGELRRLDPLTAACRLTGAVWIASLERLACQPRSNPRAEAGYLLADLDGVIDGKLNLPAERRFNALTWIAGQDIVVLEESWQGLFGGQAKSAVWVYEVRSGASHRLARNLDLGSSVVYAGY